MKAIVQHFIGTTEEWETINPRLYEAVWGIEITAEVLSNGHKRRYLKIGMPDPSNPGMALHWNDLPYFDASYIHGLSEWMKQVEEKLESLQEQIDKERQERIEADEQLQANIDAERQERIEADEELQADIDAEKQAREAGDEELQENIELLYQHIQNIVNNIISITGSISAVEIQRILALYHFSTADARVRAPGNVDIGAGVSELDGVQLAEGDMVLLAEQSDKKENGLYVVQDGALIRAPGYEASDGRAFDYTYIAVRKGSGAGIIYTLATKTPYTIGQDEIEFLESAFSFDALPGKIVIRDRDGKYEGGGGSGNGNGGDGDALVLVALVVTSLPNKSVYAVGEAFNPAGLVVKGIFLDETVRVIYPGDGTSGYTLSAPDMGTLGTKTITVTYQGKTTSFTIAVSPGQSVAVLTGITITSLPHKLQYEAGDIFISAGLAVLAVYSDGSGTMLNALDYSVSSPDMSTPGSKNVAVSYHGYTQSFTINVGQEGSYDGEVDNETIISRDILTILNVSTYQEAWEILHQRINADGLANYHDLNMGNYLDITGGLTQPYPIYWNPNYLNLRLIILGFNCYKGINNNTKNHIVWGFKNIIEIKNMNNVAISLGGYPSMSLKPHIENTLLPRLIAALGHDYFYAVNRKVLTIPGETMIDSKLWLPSAGEAGIDHFFDTITPVYFPYYRTGQGNRIKHMDGSPEGWWTSTVYDQGSGGQGALYVTPTGAINGVIVSGNRGVSPHFCQI